MLAPLGHHRWITDMVERLPFHLRTRACRWRERREREISQMLAQQGHPLNPLPTTIREDRHTRGRASEAHARANAELTALVDTALGGPVAHVPGGLAATHSDIREAAETITERLRAIPIARSAIFADTDTGEILGKARPPDDSERFERLIERAEQIADCRVPGKTDEIRWRRATDPAWWKRRLRREVGWRREAVWQLIAPTAIQWVSRDGLDDHRTAQRAAATFLNSKYAIPADGGAPIPLAELAEGREERQHAELMARTSAIGSIADEAGLVPRFITVTTPSRMHPTTCSGAGGRRPNPQFDRTLARQAYDWILSREQRWRRALRRRGIDCPYAVGVQVHEDGTPHTHMCVWALPEHWPEIERLALKYWWDCEPDSRVSPDLRVQVKTVDGGTPGALRYLARTTAFITANVDGEEDEFEAEATAAAARVHGFRRYRTSKAHTSVWRYLRRRDVDVRPLGKSAVLAQQAACRGDYATFHRHRADADLRPAYREVENRYREMTKRLIGVKCGDQIAEPSRQWRIRDWHALPPATQLFIKNQGGDSTAPNSVANDPIWARNAPNPPTGPPDLLPASKQPDLAAIPEHF